MNTYYFPHDNDSYSDEKIIDLRIKHGIAGFGVYWALIEYLHQNNGYIDYDPKRIAFALQIDLEILQSVLDDFGLFSIDGKKVFSQRLLSHLDQRNDIAEKRRNAGMKGGKAKALAIAKQMPSKTLAKSSKGKERKGKERRGEETKFTPPTLEEAVEFGKLKGYTAASRKAWVYYDAGGWKDKNGTKVLNWKQKFQSVWFKDEDKDFVDKAPNLSELEY